MTCTLQQIKEDEMERHVAGAGEKINPQKVMI
jgi:hypothetical protein